MQAWAPTLSRIHSSLLHALMALYSCLLNSIQNNVCYPFKSNIPNYGVFGSQAGNTKYSKMIEKDILPK